MKIRTFQPGDEAQQVAIYNAAAGNLPKFKPATLVEVQRRVRARDFDPATRFYAEENGQLVGYCNFNLNGRVSHPWCLPGQETLADGLFTHALEAMRQRGMRQAFAAYRGDWPTVSDYFLRQGFQRAREMINFVIDLLDLPTAPARPAGSFTPLTKNDIPSVLAMMPEALRVNRVEDLERHLLHNPYFPPEALFVSRSRAGGEPLAVGILINELTYADPRQVDASMPCFRLGAFGTEGMQTKRVKGLFSFLTRRDQNVPGLALDLLSQAAFRLRDDDTIEVLAGQVASDVPVLAKFYERYFRKQGSFPVFERSL